MILNAASEWFLWVPGVVIVIGGAVAFGWLYRLTKKIDDHTTRISYMEGKLNGHKERE